MRTKSRLRGQPLLVLILLLGGWGMARAFMWQPLFPMADFVAQSHQGLADLAGDRGKKTNGSANRSASIAPPPVVLPARAPALMLGSSPDSLTGLANPDVVLPQTPALPGEWGKSLQFTPTKMSATPDADGRQGRGGLRPIGAVGHNLMLVAALSRIRQPREIAARMGLTPRDGPQMALSAAPAAGIWPAARRSGGDRLSVDGWLLLREDTTTPVTSGRGSYGQSQLGAVIRYQLEPSSRHRPAAYARASKALAGAREAEAALGLSARPIAGVPVVAAAEMRLTQQGGKTTTRAAAYAYTQLAPVKLPLDFRGEAYAQAGYVGGDFATAFVDGQARIDREVARLGQGDLRAGAGAWGGAQKGAARLDIGPSASVGLDLGGTSARLSVDWRLRVAGQAEPGSGPALTISAGF